MKKIKVEMSAFYGYGCGYCSYGSNDTIELEVEDSVVEILEGMQEKGISLDQDGLSHCIEGCTEYPLTDCNKALLCSLHEELSAKHEHMVNKYWVFEADNECERESLESAMEKDIEDGTYQHSLTFEEFLETSEEEYEDEEDAQWNYDDRLYEDYREWVFSHDEDEEIYFIAERVGCDLDCCDTPVEYTITIL